MSVTVPVINAVILSKAGSNDVEYGILYQDGMLLAAGDQPDEGQIVASGDALRKGIVLTACPRGSTLSQCTVEFLRSRGVQVSPRLRGEGPALVTVQNFGGSGTAAGIVMGDRVKYRMPQGAYVVRIEQLMNLGGAIMPRANNW